MDGAGESAAWEELNYVFTTSNQILSTRNQLLEVEIFDHNDMRAHAQIGSTFIDISSCEVMLNRSVTLEAVILDKKKKKAGYIKITCVLGLKGASAERAEERLRKEVR